MTGRHGCQALWDQVWSHVSSLPGSWDSVAHRTPHPTQFTCWHPTPNCDASGDRVQEVTEVGWRPEGGSKPPGLVFPRRRQRPPPSSPPRERRRVGTRGSRRLQAGERPRQKATLPTPQPWAPAPRAVRRPGCRSSPGFRADSWRVEGRHSAHEACCPKPRTLPEAILPSGPTAGHRPPASPRCPRPPSGTCLSWPHSPVRPGRPVQEQRSPQSITSPRSSPLGPAAHSPC